jgi:hypothetical protein
MNKADDLKVFLAEARSMNSAVASNSNLMLDLLHNNLKHCGHYRLARLKKELRNFNSVTGKWT